MIQSLESSLGLIPQRKSTNPHNFAVLLLISMAAILISALPSSASASANVSQKKSVDQSHLLLFTTSSLKNPLK